MQQTQLAKVGRPRQPIDKAKADAICEAIAKGQSARSICSKPDMPCYGTVLEWIKRSPEFAKQYTQAREDQADWYAEEIMSVCERAVSGEVDVNAARLMVDSLKWTSSKLKPKVYGDRQVIEHDISDGLAKRMEQAEQRRLQAGSGSKGASATIIDAATGRPEPE